MSEPRATDEGARDPLEGSEPTSTGVAPGLLVVAAGAGVATWAASTEPLVALRLSPLVIGILLGALVGNLLPGGAPKACASGVRFAGTQLLRLGIVLYGFHITFGAVAEIGAAGFALDVIMVGSTLVLGVLFGTRVLGLDRATSALIASGAAICGAAAVIATEPVVRAPAHKTAVAVGIVVVFGTLSMFLYPILYRVGWLPMPPEIFGVYIGATVHEVAHVVGAGDAVSTATAQTAVVVKMTRVMLLAPALVGIGWWWKRGRDDGSHEAASAGVPWFALGFIAVVGFNSLRLLPQDVVSQIISLDSFLLTMAMTALGLSTVVRELRGLGWVPLQLGLALFVWLVAGGYGLTRLLMG